jgi:hypothetical protein
MDLQGRCNGLAAVRASTRILVSNDEFFRVDQSPQ